MTTRCLLPNFLASLLLFPLATFLACTPQVREYGGGGAGGSSGSGGMPCGGDGECGANSECQSFACMNGTCVVNFASMGAPVALQSVGDCQSKVCDGKGYIIEVVDLADAADDGNPCTLDACVGTETQHGFLAAGMACNGSQYCDGFGYCVECLDSAQCMSSVCVSNTCAAPECSDGVRNGTESDIDCGGAQCPRCPPGLACAVNSDCKSQVCNGGLCVAPTCNDSVTNGQETYIDCGGPDCPPCKAGAPCNAGLDCDSNVCLAGNCQSAACDDKVMNGGESDIDCGGPCTLCYNGRGCFTDSDCSSNHCCLGGPNMTGYCEKAIYPCPVPSRSELPQ